MSRLFNVNLLRSGEQAVQKKTSKNRGLSCKKRLPSDNKRITAHKSLHLAANDVIIGSVPKMDFFRLIKKGFATL